MSTATPYGWLEVEFGELFSDPTNDIVDGPFGSNLKASEYVSSGVPVVRLQNIDRNKFVTKNIQHVTVEKAKELSRHTFAPGDILITKLGDPLGKACLAPGSISKGILVADVVRARLTHNFVDNRFLCYQLNSYEMAEQFKNQTKGTTRPRVNLTKIRSLKARLCPLREQERIVEKLEELLSDLDAGTEELKSAQRNLTQYRPSLLKAAVEGELTADWRATQGTPQETGSDLLKRILASRQGRWEQKQLERFAEQGKTPPKDWRTKYPQPIAPDLTDLPLLPAGWAWATIDQCAIDEDGITDGPFGSNLKSEHYTESGPRVIRLQNIGDGRFLDSYAHISEEHYERLRKHSAIEGDVVVAMLGEVLPRSCVIPKGIAPAIVKADCARIRLNQELISPALAVAALNSVPTRNRIKGLVKGVGRPRINLSHIRSIPVPLPPTAEQAQMLGLLSEALESCDLQNSAIERGFVLAAAQRNSIFKFAFAGQLVPQDPTDEPASELLPRIRNARTRTQQPKANKAKKQKEIVLVARRLIDVLTEAGDWIPAQEAFRLCGVADGASTDQIEAIYAELRALDKTGVLQVESIIDSDGRKRGDKLRIGAT